MGQYIQQRTGAVVTVSVLLLSGCAAPSNDGGFVSRFLNPDQSVVASSDAETPAKGGLLSRLRGDRTDQDDAPKRGLFARKAAKAGEPPTSGFKSLISRVADRPTDTENASPSESTDSQAAESRIITVLQARQTILEPSSPFDEVAGAVLAANSRTAEAELRAARLRAEAMSKNWLPTLGPNISLTSMGDIITSLVVDQVLFDHGRKKAERDFAKADVEVAAVALADDTNDRVYTALGLYLDAAKAREAATLAHRQLTDMGKFEWVMSERVKGGISDRSDLNILRQKLSEIRATHASELETATSAMAELDAMSLYPLSDIRGLSEVQVGTADALPLAVLKAEAEKERTIAQAKIDRAGLLPGLTASGKITGDGTTGALTAGGDGPIGFGTGANLKAIELAKETAGRKVNEAREESNRHLRRLQQRQKALTRQMAESETLTREAKANLDLFQEQYEAGQRQVMDVVGVYETYARQETTRVGLKYERVRSQLEIARLLGLLADGSKI